MSLAKDRLTPARLLTLLNLAVAANVLCYAGGLAALDANGRVTPGATATGLKGIGRFKDRVDNSTGSAGDLNADVERGCFQYANSSSADAITEADVGRPCFIVDDQTVAKTDGGGTRSVAGVVADVDADGVWVDFTEPVGRGKVYISMPTMSSKASDAAVSRRVSPVKGTITKIWNVSSAALATGDATLTGKIGATGITNGVITITNAGSAAGDVDSAAPTAANLVNEGDVISFTGGGASTATANADLVLEITL